MGKGFVSPVGYSKHEKHSTALCRCQRIADAHLKLTRQLTIRLTFRAANERPHERSHAADQAGRNTCLMQEHAAAALALPSHLAGRVRFHPYCARIADQQAPGLLPVVHRR